MPRGRTPSKNKQQADEEIARQWLNFASESMTGRPLKPNKTQSMKTFTKQQINSMLLNPQLNYESLQNISQLFMTKVGVYKRLVEYFAFMLTYDVTLDPITIPSSIRKNVSKYEKAWESAALQIEKLKPKSILPILANAIFTNGEVFIYKIEDKTSIENKIIPNKYCLPYTKTDGVYSFVIDMQKFVSLEDPISYPLEIQKAYSLYKDGKHKELFIEGQYYEVSSNGVCFTTIPYVPNSIGGHAIPPFSGIFCDLVGLDESKELQSEIDKLDNTKMIHNKIPLNKDSIPIMEPSLAKEYNRAIKDNLSSGIFSIVNPFESTVLGLNDKTQRTTSIVQEAVSGVFNSSGISSLLFNNEKASGEALKRSIIVDAMSCISILIPMFTDYLSREVSNQTKTINWKCEVQPFTHHDRDLYRDKAFKELAYGGSKFTYFATCGLSPIQGFNRLVMEDILSTGDLFKPVMSAHTISGDTTNTGGRPTNKSKGETISPITDQQNETL